MALLHHAQDFAVSPLRRARRLNWRLLAALTATATFWIAVPAALLRLF